MIKIKHSMARLLTVVNERKRLRNEYRKHLEDEYIKWKKKEEQEAYEKELMEKRENGEQTEMTQKELWKSIKDR